MADSDSLSSARVAPRSDRVEMEISASTSSGEAAVDSTAPVQDKIYGPRLYARDVAAYNRMRKVEPLNMAMDPYVGWVTGLRRADSEHRATAPALSLDRTGRLKISPIITWDLDDTDAYIKEHDLIIHPLTLQGYRSIGCAPLTFPVGEGEDARSGRVFADGKTECGLHE